MAAATRPLRWAMALWARLPLRLQHAAGTALGWLAWRFSARKRGIVLDNLRRVRPQATPQEQRRLARAILLESGRGLAELPGIWGDVEATLARVVEVRGEALLQAARDDGRGLILCAPHLGSWEVANYWLARRLRFAIFYRQLKSPWLDALLREVRGPLGTVQFTVDDAGVRDVYRHLQRGGIVSIMPDHVPKGGGVLAPFFGAPALTMTLLPRLVRRTGAQVLLLFVERLPRGAGFRLQFKAPPAGLDDADPVRACTALNAAVESCVREAFAQYQWTYRRFKRAPAMADDGPPG